MRRHLTAEEAAIWREITASVRPDWFWSSEFLLEIFVRAIALERWLSAQVRATDPSDPRLPQWLALQRAEAKVIASYATMLRLTPRSTWDRYTPKVVSRLPKPWELGGNPPPDDKPDGSGSPFSAV
jgi:hypothetical protein